MLCQGCARTGLHPLFGGDAKPRWCKCTKSRGPYVAAPGTVVRIEFRKPLSAEEAAFETHAKAVSRRHYGAREALVERWVRCGRGWRELPRGNRKREALEREYANACRALDRVQRQCKHETRSFFNAESCDLCHADLPSPETIAWRKQWEAERRARRRRAA